ncbi:MAG: hypothetical protein JNM82_13030, partial [Rhodocyclaceae bacterium]|nr:hypothetical protein [Rhodocyclaceae bacterium]
YLVSRKIRREGTPGRHMFRDAFAEGGNTVAAIFEKTLRRIQERMAAEGGGLAG